MCTKGHNMGAYNFVGGQASLITFSVEETEFYYIYYFVFIFSTLLFGSHNNWRTMTYQILKKTRE
jgi:hypothetical protein